MENVDILKTEQTVTEIGCITFTMITWCLFTPQNTNANVSIAPFITLFIAISFYFYNFLTTRQLDLIEKDIMRTTYIIDNLFGKR